MRRARTVLTSAAVLLLVVGWLVVLWFAMDLFSAPNCDPATAWDHCTTVSGPGPGNGH